MERLQPQPWLEGAVNQKLVAWYQKRISNQEIKYISEVSEEIQSSGGRTCLQGKLHPKPCSEARWW